ncbi:hypothetical protein GJAV_G00068630 [Gymnothorax javanicus]|nr:hypothetical protein GJAV_G00068630 [Gymnothorax javanicus]
MHRLVPYLDISVAEIFLLFRFSPARFASFCTQTSSLSVGSTSLSLSLFVGLSLLFCWTSFRFGSCFWCLETPAITHLGILTLAGGADPAAEGRVRFTVLLQFHQYILAAVWNALPNLFNASLRRFISFISFINLVCLSVTAEPSAMTTTSI